MDITEHRTGTDPTTEELAGSATPPGDAGAPADGAGPAPGPTAGTPAREHARFTLRRSRGEAMLGGVCGGLAEELDVDPALLRIAVVTLTLATGGMAALVYLLAWVIAPVGDPAV